MNVFRQTQHTLERLYLSAGLKCSQAWERVFPELDMSNLIWSWWPVWASGLSLQENWPLPWLCLSWFLFVWSFSCGNDAFSWKDTFISVYRLVSTQKWKNWGSKCKRESVLSGRHFYMWSFIWNGSSLLTGNPPLHGQEMLFRQRNKTHNGNRFW